jgi:hypothetical protein
MNPLAMQKRQAGPRPRVQYVGCRTIDAQNIGNNFRVFAILNTAHRTLTHCLQRGMIEDVIGRAHTPSRAHTASIDELPVVS